MNFVYSTGTASTDFCIYEPYRQRDANDQSPVPIEKKIRINGGSNLADKHLVTPLGVVTMVSDEDLELLKNDYHFKEQMKHGFIKIEARKKDVEVVIKDMQKKDGSAPKTPGDYAEDGRVKPVTVKKK